MKKLLCIGALVLLAGCTRTSLIIVDGNRGITGAIKGKIVKVTDWTTAKSTMGYKSKYTIEIKDKDIAIIRETEPIK